MRYTVKNENKFDGMTVEEVIGTVYEYKEIHDFLNDPQMTRALELLARFYGSAGDVPYVKAAGLIVELQALSTDFAAKAIFYQTIGKQEPDSAHRKNIYYSMRDAMSRLSDSLKYMLK